MPLAPAMTGAGAGSLPSEVPYPARSLDPCVYVRRWLRHCRLVPCRSQMWPWPGSGKNKTKSREIRGRAKKRAKSLFSEQSQGQFPFAASVAGAGTRAPQRTAHVHAMSERAGYGTSPGTEPLPVPIMAGATAQSNPSTNHGTRAAATLHRLQSTKGPAESELMHARDDGRWGTPIPAPAQFASKWGLTPFPLFATIRPQIAPTPPDRDPDPALK